MAIPPHHTVYFGTIGNQISIKPNNEADFMVLLGAPLNEPVSAQGSKGHEHTQSN